MRVGVRLCIDNVLVVARGKQNTLAHSAALVLQLRRKGAVLVSRRRWNQHAVWFGFPKMVDLDSDVQLTAGAAWGSLLAQWWHLTLSCYTQCQLPHFIGRRQLECRASFAHALFFLAHGRSYCAVSRPSSTVLWHFCVAR